MLSLTPYRETVNILSRVTTYAATQYKAPLKAPLSALVRPSPASTGPTYRGGRRRQLQSACFNALTHLLAFFLFLNPC